ncbi:hypothetical protein O0I10_008447 [Lichtheimia ornata]|uniref:Uncharacterized protein n=1 Tax=Lichtheimia ornata TaxID=688661 RepID=A0AAD7UZ95_9FUNG|nr:uncharacterized protein O0I10_008447 [Lichtheimia ornata]KAJ8655783.1 hypothetical protein O0I10_008447 [Lichtheimia ornata]
MHLSSPLVSAADNFSPSGSNSAHGEFVATRSMHLQRLVKSTRQRWQIKRIVPIDDVQSVTFRMAAIRLGRNGERSYQQFIQLENFNVHLVKILVVLSSQHTSSYTHLLCRSARTIRPIDKGKHGVTAKEENINQCQFGVEYKIQVSSMANLGVNFNALQGSNGKAYDECKIWDDTAVIRIIYVEGTCFINNIYIVDEDGIIKKMPSSHDNDIDLLDPLSSLEINSRYRVKPRDHEESAFHHLQTNIGGRIRHRFSNFISCCTCLQRPQLMRDAAFIDT